jgi:hypothetical protein
VSVEEVKPGDLSIDYVSDLWLSLDGPLYIKPDSFRKRSMKLTLEAEGAVSLQCDCGKITTFDALPSPKGKMECKGCGWGVEVGPVEDSDA